MSGEVEVPDFIPAWAVAKSEQEWAHEKALNLAEWEQQERFVAELRTLPLAVRRDLMHGDYVPALTRAGINADIDFVIRLNEVRANPWWRHKVLSEHRSR